MAPYGSPQWQMLIADFQKISVMGSGVAAWLATPSSANLAAAVTGETGSGALVFATSPTLVTPALGTPASGTLTNCTGLLLANTVATATNDDAAAGDIGEYVSSTVLIAGAVALTTATPANVTSISLTAGDWDVTGNVVFTPAAGTTTTTLQGAFIHTVSATLPTAPGSGAYIVQNNYSNTGATNTLSAGTIRLSLSATTTVYLIAFAQFAVSTETAYGFIGARRRR